MQQPIAPPSRHPRGSGGLSKKNGAAASPDLGRRRFYYYLSCPDLFRASTEPRRALRCTAKTWMAGTSPAKTIKWAASDLYSIPWTALRFRGNDGFLL